MPSTKPEKSDLVSVNGLTNTLSPCLRLLIEIPVNEVTHSSAVTATDLEKDEEMPPIRHQSPDLAIADLAIKGECNVSK
jgi:hypothetical protein